MKCDEISPATDGWFLRYNNIWNMAFNVCGSKEVFQVEAPFCEHKIYLYFRASQNGEGRDLKNLVEQFFFTLQENLRNNKYNIYVNLIAKPEPRTRRSFYPLLSAENATNLKHKFGMDAKFMKLNNKRR